MSYDELRADILAARDRREELVDDAVTSSGEAILFASLNIPGPHKNLGGIGALFVAALQRMRELPGPIRLHREGVDALGRFAVFMAPWPAARVKRACVSLEEEAPAMRLVDLDVYDRGHGRIGRRELGLEPRRCFACARPALECIRLRRHSPEELRSHVDALLDDLSNATTG